MNFYKVVTPKIFFSDFDFYLKIDESESSILSL